MKHTTKKIFGIIVWLITLSFSYGQDYQYVSTITGNGSSFSNPTGLHVGSDRNLYVVDRDNNRAQRFDPTGNFQLQYGPYSAPGFFNEAYGICTNLANTQLYVSNRGNNFVKYYNLSSGAYVSAIGGTGVANGQLIYPMGIARSSGVNDLIVADAGNHRIQKFNMNIPVFDFQFGNNGSPGTANGHFNAPEGVAVDPVTNEIYVADTYNHRIQKFDASGNFIRTWGSFGSGQGQFNTPSGITVDNAGNVFVVDRLNHRVQKFNKFGMFLMQWGSFGTGTNQFNNPYGIAIDPVNNNVYVSDMNNNRVQKFAPVFLKSVQTITASDMVIQYGDMASPFSASSGLPLTSASSNPYAVTVNGGQIKAESPGYAYISIYQPGNASFYPVGTEVRVTVNKRNLIAQANNLTVTKCDVEYSPTISFSGFVNGETEWDLEEYPYVYFDHNGEIGQYPIDIGGGYDYRYEVIHVPGTLTITDIVYPAITGKDILPSKSYDTYRVEPAYSFMEYNWFYLGENMTVLGNTNNSYFIVAPDNNTSDGRIACEIIGCNFVDTLYKTITINKGDNLSGLLNDLVCDVPLNECTNMYISFLDVEKILEASDNSCASSGYSDYTGSGSVGTLYIGEVYTTTIRGGGQPGYFGLWIDFNNDGDFADPQEFLMGNSSPAYELVSPNILIPNDQSLKGARRLRVQCRPSGAFSAGEPCQTEPGVGEIEDYIILFDTRPSLEAPNLITPNNDGLNDYFIIRGINEQSDNRLTILSFDGVIVYQTNDYKNTWPETQVKPGTYYYIFKNGQSELRSFLEVSY